MPTVAMKTIELKTIVLKTIRLRTTVMKTTLLTSIMLKNIMHEAFVLTTTVLNINLGLQTIALLSPLGFIMMRKTNSPTTTSLMEEFANYVEVRELHVVYVDVPNHVPGRVEGDHFLARCCSQPPFLAQVARNVSKSVGWPVQDKSHGAQKPVVRLKEKCVRIGRGA